MTFAAVFVAVWAPCLAFGHGPGVVIPEAKRRALAEALQRGPVSFKNGSVVWRDEQHRADLIVTLADGSERRVNEFAHDQIAQAYEIALAGPPPPELPLMAAVKPTRSQADFGDDAPF